MPSPVLLHCDPLDGEPLGVWIDNEEDRGVESYYPEGDDSPPAVYAGQVLAQHMGLGDLQFSGAGMVMASTSPYIALFVQRPRVGNESAQQAFERLAAELKEPATESDSESVTESSTEPPPE